MYQLYYLYINLENVKVNLGSLTGDSVVMKQLWNVIIPIFEDRKSFAGTCVATVLPDPPTVNRKSWVS
jgi:hypothetical protein